MFHQFDIQQFHVLPAQFMWFVWISEQTAIISIYSINWLVFVAAKNELNVRMLSVQ